MFGTTRTNLHYFYWQRDLDIEHKLSDLRHKKTPSKWRLVDNREAYIKKRMALEGVVMNPQLAEKLGYHAALNFKRGMPYNSLSIAEMDIQFDILWEEVFGFWP